MKHCMIFSEKENPRFGTRKINIERWSIVILPWEILKRRIPVMLR